MSLRSRNALFVFLCGIVAGCASSRPAPVVERTAPQKQAAAAPARAAAPATKSGPRPVEGFEFYTVKPGDTLYSIALEHGLDYRELASWNGLDNPGALRVGQQLRVSAPYAGAAAASAGTAAVVAPLNTPAGTIEAKPLGSGPAAAALPPPTASASAAAAAGPNPSGALVTEPKAVRMPYSDQALAQLSKPDAPPVRVESARSDPRADVQRPETRAETKPESSDSARAPEDLDWAWPAKGKVIGTFSEGSNKGIAIAGRMGQPVLASAPGRVIFSGTGIRGFGKLVVIKHNNTYLSVYAHNSELVVKEGQTVAKGQKIAEMGNSDADQVKLHFEIRRFGKPVDPLRLLPSPA